MGEQPPWQGNQSQADNLGGVFAWRKYTNDGARCRTELVQFSGESDEVIAYIQEVQQPGFPWEQRIDELSLTFDEKRGRLFFSFGATCFGEGDPGCESSSAPGTWLLRFDGFTTEFEILQSYRPPPLGLSFRVPLNPEGLAGVDWFDTYYGGLDTVGDWAEAQPLQCGEPEAPAVGDFLSVEDSLPPPEPGHGYYFITAATYQGETRYGRASDGGVPTGRHPEVLPACE